MNRSEKAREKRRRCIAAAMVIWQRRKGGGGDRLSGRGLKPVGCRREGRGALAAPREQWIWQRRKGGGGRLRGGG